MQIFTTYFNSTQIYLLILSMVFFITSIFFHLRNKETWSVIFIVTCSICIFSFAALLDPFLNLWDERFHALVAKNLMNHPFKPTLYDDPVVTMAYDNWDRYHIWLHKQPLFLWQIALSFKLFGVSEFSLRIPNIILGSAMVYAAYRSGKLLVNKTVGLLTSMFVISTFYIIELASGRQELDHNDLTFLVYVSLSIWAFIEYYFSNNKIWIVFIGLFSGCAILCKWLVGLLIYFGWFIYKVSIRKFKISEYADLSKALIVTTIVALPWQIIALVLYPVEAMKAFALNSQHFTSPIEAHSGTFWYHFNKFDIIYGTFAPFLILPAFIVLYRKIKNKQMFISLVSMVVVVYLFFSIAATKMPSFTIVISMLIFIAFASLFEYFLKTITSFVKIKWIQNFIFILLVLTLFIFRFDIELLQKKHTLWKKDNYTTWVQINNKKVFESLQLPSNTVLFNVKDRHYIEAMFYTDLPSYNIIPSFQQYLEMKEKDGTIAIFELLDGELPEYLTHDPEVIFINKRLW